MAVDTEAPTTTVATGEEGFLNFLIGVGVPFDRDLALKLGHGFCDTSKLGTLHAVIALAPPALSSSYSSVLSAAALYLCPDQFTALYAEVQFLQGR